MADAAQKAGRFMGAGLQVWGQPGQFSENVPQNLKKKGQGLQLSARAPWLWFPVSEGKQKMNKNPSYLGNYLGVK